MCTEARLAIEQGRLRQDSAERSGVERRASARDQGREQAALGSQIAMAQLDGGGGGSGGRRGQMSFIRPFTLVAPNDDASAGVPPEPPLPIRTPGRWGHVMCGACESYLVSVAVLAQPRKHLIKVWTRSRLHNLHAGAAASRTARAGRHDQLTPKSSCLLGSRSNGSS